MSKDPLPPPVIDVSVDQPSSGTHRVSVTGKRPGSQDKLWIGHGTNPEQATKDVVKKIFDDPTSAEYIRKG